MREIARLVNGNKMYIIKSDGGSYVIELFIEDVLYETKIFNEHTLRIVENYGKNWMAS